MRASTTLPNLPNRSLMWSSVTSNTKLRTHTPCGRSVLGGCGVEVEVEVVPAGACQPESHSKNPDSHGFLG